MKNALVKDYLNDIRKKNKSNALKYDKLIINCPYVTNLDELEELKDILYELKDENKDFYDYIIDLLKTSSDITEIFLLYKEYKKARIREELLEKEILNKEIELDLVKEKIKESHDDLFDYNSEVTKLKDMGKILDDLEKTININIDSLFTKLEKEEDKKISFGMKGLLALSSYLAFKNNKNVIGTLLVAYLSTKVLDEFFSSKKNKYLNLCEDYLNSLENYYDDALNIEKELINNLDLTEKLEKKLKQEYKEYLDEKEFKDIFKVIHNIKDTVKRSLDDVSKTKDHIDKSIDISKTKVKQLEG